MFLGFDLETTGLFINGLSIDNPKQPKIVQISAILMDPDWNEVDRFDRIIRPDGWEIPEGAEKCHGISTAKALEEGDPLEDVLRDFNSLSVQADKIIGHNLAYDLKVLQHNLKLIKRKMDLPKAQCCTMLMAKDVLKLPPNFPGGDYRWPNLGATYEFLFGKPMENAHNSLYDVLATLEIYKELKDRGIEDTVPVKDKSGMKLSEWEEHGKSKQGLVSVLDRVEEGDGVLSQWEMEFCDDMREKLAKYDDRAYLSEKQWEVIERIGKKLDDECI